MAPVSARKAAGVAMSKNPAIAPKENPLIQRGPKTPVTSVNGLRRSSWQKSVAAVITPSC
jgi:hypothetical protein